MREMMSEAADNGNIIDAKDMYGKFALDAIATSGFGIESNSFKDPDNAFREHARRLIRSFRIDIKTLNLWIFIFRDPKYASVWDMPKFILAFIAPKIGKALGISALNAQSTKFFVNIVRQAMANRRWWFKTSQIEVFLMKILQENRSKKKWCYWHISWWDGQREKQRRYLEQRGRWNFFHIHSHPFLFRWFWYNLNNFIIRWEKLVVLE